MAVRAVQSLSTIFFTAVAVVGGNVTATILISFWNGGGLVAPFGSPGGVLTALVQGSVGVFLLQFLLDKFSDPRLIRIPAIVLSCIGIILTTFSTAVYLIPGVSMSGSLAEKVWSFLASVVGTVPWILIAVSSVRDRRLRLQNDLTTPTPLV